MIAGMVNKRSSIIVEKFNQFLSENGIPFVVADVAAVTGDGVEVTANIYAAGRRTK